MAKVTSLLDRLRAVPPRRPAPPAAAPCVIPLPRPPAERMTAVRPFDAEWDDPRKAANHAPEKR